MKKINQTQAALSIIEILIAVGLMSMILTALAVNMAYTQRSINNAQLRAKATDYVGSCMRKFRNLRDSNSWPNFCQAINGPVATLNTTACGPAVINESGQDIGTRTLTVATCNTSGSTDENAKVTVTFTYQDLSGNTRTVSQSQEFQKAPYEANFR